MSTAVSAPQWTNDEWRAWLADVISFLNSVHSVTFMMETLSPTLVGRFYRHHMIVVFRIEAELEDKAALLNDVLTELGLHNLFGQPGTRHRTPLYAVPALPEEPPRRVWSQQIRLDQPVVAASSGRT